jgi:Asp-tRNA(Asn)/Glu-tRNA(Gln) amidotransferase A subunit family amidase
VIEDTVCRGPLTRTVEDAALHLDVVAGPHPLDPNSLPHPGISYRQVLRDLPGGLRVGFSADLGFAVVQNDVAEVVYDAARVFEELGHRFEEPKTAAPHLGADWGMVGALELYPKLSDKLPEHREEFGRAFLRGVLGAIEIDAERWGRIRERRAALGRWCAEIFDRYDPDRSLRPAAGEGPLPVADRRARAAAGGCGELHHPLQSLVAPGRDRAGRPLEGRPPRRPPDRRPAPPR